MPLAKKFTIWMRNRDPAHDAPFDVPLSETDCFAAIGKLWQVYRIPFSDLEITTGIPIGDKVKEWKE